MAEILGAVDWGPWSLLALFGLGVAYGVRGFIQWLQSFVIELQNDNRASQAALQRNQEALQEVVRENTEASKALTACLEGFRSESRAEHQAILAGQRTVQRE